MANGTGGRTSVRPPALQSCAHEAMRVVRVVRAGAGPSRKREAAPLRRTPILLAEVRCLGWEPEGRRDGSRPAQADRPGPQRLHACPSGGGADWPRLRLRAPGRHGPAPRQTAGGGRGGPPQEWRSGRQPHRELAAVRLALGTHPRARRQWHVGMAERQAPAVAPQARGAMPRLRQDVPAEAQGPRRHAHLLAVLRAAPPLLAALVALALPAAAHAHKATYRGSATAYNSCDGSTSMTASGRRARYGWAANNSLPLWTVIKITRPKSGVFVGDRKRKYFRIMDRGGPGFALDFWMSCRSMYQWGRRSVSFRVVSRP